MCKQNNTQLLVKSEQHGGIVMDKIKQFETATDGPYIPTVNLHFIGACNGNCIACFSRPFRELGSGLPKEDLISIAHKCRDELRTEKINLSGGEPTMRDDLGAIIKGIHRLGLKVGLVTNGYKLDILFAEDAIQHIDILGFSVDSWNDDINRKLGRPIYPEGYSQRILGLIHRVREVHPKAFIKLNVVVSRQNWQENMVDKLLLAHPNRLKFLQILPVKGAISDDARDLLIDEKQFNEFVLRHKAPLEKAGISVIPENNIDMTESYAMVDPHGYVFCNSNGRYQRGRSILKDGPVTAFKSVKFNLQGMKNRGGIY